MPYYDPKSQLGKGPQPWNPDWGLGSEMMGTFEQPVQEDPDRFKQPAAPHMPLSFHTQMFGGMVTDPETGDQFYVKLKAPPEPQGNQSWHHGLMEGEWSDHALARHNNNYFAKLETAPWTKTQDLGNVPVHVLQQNGFIEDPIKMRATYAGGPPTTKHAFPGLRELPAAFGPEYDGFQKRRHFVAPAPITGKELRPANYAGRITAPIGAQRIQAMPHESTQITKGKDSGGSSLNSFSHRVGGVVHTSGSLVDRMRTANERHLDVQSSADSLDRVRNSANAGQFSPNPLANSSQVGTSARLAKDQTYSLNHVRPKAEGNSQLQRIAASHEHAPSYSIRREHASEPNSRVSLMRFGRPPFHSQHYTPKARKPPPGSTRLDSQSTDPDYTSINTFETVTAITGAHPDESLRDVTAGSASGVIHLVNGVTGAPAAAEVFHQEEGVGSYTVEEEQYTQPETSVRQAFYAATHHAAEEVDDTSSYSVYAATRNPETSLRIAFPPHYGDYAREPELFKDNALGRNPETSVRREFAPHFGDYAREPALFKDNALERNPETSVRREFAPHFGDYAREPALFKDNALDRHPETSVRREFGPYMGKYQNKPQLKRTSAANRAQGRSLSSAPAYVSAIPAPAMVRHEQGARGPHGVFTGQLVTPHESTQVDTPVVWKSVQSAVSADNMNRRTITETLTNAGIQVTQYSDPTPYMLYDNTSRTQMYFPPAPTAAQ